MKIYLLLIFLFAEDVLAQIGETCTMDNTGRTGICQSISNCPIAKQQAREHKIRPTICGRDYNALPIVCCEGQEQPNKAGSGDIGSNIRISEQKYIEYNKPTGGEAGFISLVADSKPIKPEISKCDYGGNPLIVGGTPAITGEFAFMAALGYNVNGEIYWNCGGTLISRKFVVTAAHCLWSLEFGAPEVVRLGENDLKQSNDGAVDFGILRSIKHPKHSTRFKYNDIALLELNRKVKFTEAIRPACLWNKNAIAASTAIATGWGLNHTYAIEGSDKLLKVKLNLIPNSLCEAAFETTGFLPSGLSDSMLCAGDLEKPKDTCQGDSGGPLFITRKGSRCTFYVIGVTSFGNLGCATKSPSVYTRISSYIEWIEKTVW